jgi:hypothetical protein
MEKKNQEKVPKIRNEKASFPGKKANAAGMKNPKKQKDAGNLGAEPLKDDELNRGE